MSNTIEERRSGRDNIIFATKLVLLIYTMLIAVPWMQHWLYFGKKLACAWTLALSGYLLFADTAHFKTKEYLMMGLFCISYAVTIVLNIRSYFVNEVLILGYTVSLFFMLTYCDGRRSHEAVKKELWVLMYAIIAVSFVFSAVNIWIYFDTYPGMVRGTTGSYFYGIIGGQLGGIYNPNTGGTINYISILLALLVMHGAEKKKKIFLWVNIVLQFWCFSLVQSRGAWVSLIAFIVLYFAFVWDRASLNLPQKVIAKVLLIALCIPLAMGLSKGMRHTTVGIINRPSDDIVIDGQDESTADKNRPGKHDDITSGDRDISNEGVSDFTTGRAEIWSIGMKKLRQQPLMGVGYRSIDDVLAEGLSEYDYDNSGAGGLHNVYLTVLLSSGIVGGALFAAVLILLLLKVLKIYRSKTAPVYVKYLATLIPVWLAGDLVESRIALSFNQMSVLFWIIAGYVLYFAKECENHDQSDRPGL